MHPAQPFLETLTLVLCAAGVTTVVFQYLRQPVVLGYLLAGMAIGPYIPIPFIADKDVVATLAELGVILLMFALGIEFSLHKLIRVGPTAGFVAIVQCSLMVWLGYLAGQGFGWSRLESIYAGAVVAISSTTIIIKAFEEQRVKGDYVQIVFGVLIVEDLIAILLITMLTALSVGEGLSILEISLALGKLVLFLVLLLVVGLMIIPRWMRMIVALNRPEITVVTSIGLAFACAYLAAAQGYSVALGAFLAGSLVAESGVQKTVEHLVQPVRDIFGAIFFVSVGMMIDPAEIAAHWSIVLVFLAVVVIGKVGSVTLSAILTGQSIQTSVKAGMSLAQIGEFSFIIAGVGLATGATGNRLYSIAVAVSGITTLLTPWLIRWAQHTATLVDRRLPRSLQTFIALYGSWLEQLRAGTTNEAVARTRRLARWLAVDVVIVAAIIIAVATQSERLSQLVIDHLEVMPKTATWLLVGVAVLLAAPFSIGIIRVAKSLGFDLANRAFPRASDNKIDLADAPRRLLVVTLQLTIIVLVSLPLLAITQPFLPLLWGAIIPFVLAGLLAVSFWRGAVNFEGHTRAAAQVIVEALARQMRKGRATEKNYGLEDVNQLLHGLGSPVSVRLPPESPAVGKTLAEINLRGLTGATVLAIQRANEAIAVPIGSEMLHADDVLAIAGNQRAIEAAKEILIGQDSNQLN